MTALMHAPRCARRVGTSVSVFLLTLVLTGCGINTIPTLEEQAKAAWSEVLNQYQRRADLVPNLVETVKGAASFERDTLEAVVNARSQGCADDRCRRTF